MDEWLALAFTGAGIKLTVPGIVNCYQPADKPICSLNNACYWVLDRILCIKKAHVSLS
jgi:hypothetical protein